MIKKIDILGIQLDNYTVREAIMRVEAWYDNNMLNVIEMVSMQMLTESESDPVLKEVISSLDLAVIGEKGILLESIRCSGSARQKKMIFQMNF